MPNIEGYRVGVVGATGLVGQHVLASLVEREFPVSDLLAFASRDSVGKRIGFGDRDLASLHLDSGAIQGLDLAFVCTDNFTSRNWAPRLARAGIAVIDKTSEWRMAKPLIVPEVNPEALDNFDGIVSSPNCSTIQAVLPLKPIMDAVGLNRIKVHTWQAVSGSGAKAITELHNQSSDVVAAKQPRDNNVYPHQIAFNVLPQVGEEVENGYFDEEIKIINETRKILKTDCQRIGAACTRVAVFNGHSTSIEFTPKERLSAKKCRELLSNAAGVEVVLPYPTAIDACGQDKVRIGLIREDRTVDNGMEMWVVADNLRKGAATNAVQIAELMIKKGII